MLIYLKAVIFLKKVSFSYVLKNNMKGTLKVLLCCVIKCTVYQFLQFNCSTGITSHNLFIMSQVGQHDMLMKKALWWKYLSEEKDFVVILFRICLYCYECLRCYVIYEKKLYKFVLFLC